MSSGFKSEIPHHSLLFLTSHSLLLYCLHHSLCVFRVEEGNITLLRLLCFSFLYVHHHSTVSTSYSSTLFSSYYSALSALFISPLFHSIVLSTYPHYYFNCLLYYKQTCHHLVGQVQINCIASICHIYPHPLDDSCVSNCIPSYLFIQSLSAFYLLAHQEIDQHRKKGIL